MKNVTCPLIKVYISKEKEIKKKVINMIDIKKIKIKNIKKIIKFIEFS